MFNMTSEELRNKNAIHTATEIYQQPAVWRELADILSAQKTELNNFIDSIYEKHEHVRVVLSGAGTSAFIGDTLVPVLTRETDKNVQFEAIATTDIVSNPEEYLQKHVPTILVSFARSGNSPESVATVKLCDRIVDQFYHVVITCNKDGQLAKDTKGDENAITILMPEKANDKSLAMTSSFTCMLITAYTLFTSREIDKNVMYYAENLIERVMDNLDEILAFDFERISYLGSGMLSQLSHEAALKMLELTAGKVVAIHESSLGFRHGPKSILNDKSAVVVFVSKDPYTRKYDLDILREVSNQDADMKVIALTEKEDAEITAAADWVIPVTDGENSLAGDFELALLYVIVAQALAMNKSLQLGLTPDNPSVDGSINRVVQGVTIYDYDK
ncbi:SIS domain-containing protein [Virgibacillus sp. YIM 98842]|uniref:SIS domain-containing protein n=1 Tax=Virgibacillus sp. YIM 98842 TaxID=2663533 RepID=UPI0013D97E7D|nr:SIS domain-containing protein [Virgibacillus sp. YIM 98842]